GKGEKQIPGPSRGGQALHRRAGKGGPGMTAFFGEGHPEGRLLQRLGAGWKPALRKKANSRSLPWAGEPHPVKAVGFGMGWVGDGDAERLDALAEDEASGVRRVFHGHWEAPSVVIDVIKVKSPNRRLPSRSVAILEAGRGDCVLCGNDGDGAVRFAGRADGDF